MVLTFGIYARTDFYWDLRIFISLQLFINFGNCFILKLDLMPTNASLSYLSQDYFGSPSMNQTVRLVREKLDKVINLYSTITY